MKKTILLTSLFFLLSCGGVDFLLKENSIPNQFKNNTIVLFSGEKEEGFSQEIFSFFGNNKAGSYILITSISEEKENRLVKKNQVAEKVDYQLTINYKIFYKNQDCKIYNKKIISKFSFVPKSYGYNFGTDKSLEKLYTRSIRGNIQSFINSAPKETDCL